MVKQNASNNASKTVEIHCDKHSKEVSLVVNTIDEWKLFSGNSVENIDLSKPILEGNSKGNFSVYISATQRQYFLFTSSSEQIILSEELLPMEGAHNLRDLGGMKTIDGKFVKWGKLFRAGELSKLTEEDQEYLNSIPIRTIVDFRDYSEVKREPDTQLANTERRHHFPLAPGNLAGNSDIKEEEIMSYDAHEIMIKMYSELITDPKCIGCYRQLFELLQSENNLPLLYHCTAGKDRTGVATALIYSALGVDIDSILSDYMLSNEYLEEKYGWIKKDSEFFRILLEVTPEFLCNALDIIKRNCGSVENFLINELNVNIDKMKQIYLY